jgi:hypothetical protein
MNEESNEWLFVFAMLGLCLMITAIAYGVFIHIATQ